MKYTCLSALICAPLALTSVAFSETEDLRKLETVSVTATSESARIEDIPGSVSVLSETDVDFVQSLSSAAELTRALTGVQAAVSNGSQVTFQIRGIGAVDHQALTPGAAAVYQDGVFLATNVQAGQFLYDLDRVEVLKGPQGTLYGRNASSGAIHFLSKTAADENQSRYVDLSLGRFNRVGLTFGFGDDLNADTRFRLAGRLLTEGAALENVATDPNINTAPKAAGGERREVGLRGSLFKENVFGGDLLVGAHLELDRGINPTPRNDALSVGDHQISSEGEGLQDTENELYGASVKWNSTWGAWDVQSLTALEGYNQRYGFDFDGTPAPFSVQSLNANLSYDRKFLQLSEELHFERRFDWGRSLIGATGSADTFEQVYLIWCGELDTSLKIGTCPYVGTAGRVGPTPASTGTPMSLLTLTNQDKVSVAVFSHNEIELTERLSLTLGARLTHERIEGDGRGLHIFDDGTVGVNNRDGVGYAIGGNTVRDTRPSGNIALSYAFEKVGQLYASISNGFKSGGFNGEVQNNSTHWIDAGLFDVETVTAYEIGYKSPIWDGLYWSVAGFYQDYDAPQARIFVSFDLPDGSTIVSNSLSNLDEAEVFGFEGSAVWSPLEAMTIEAGVTVLDSEIKQSNNLGGNASVFDGNPLPFSSDWSGRLAVMYNWTVATGLNASARISAKYNDGFFLDAEGRDDRYQDGYTLLDADLTLSHEDSDWRFSIWGRNLLDEDYAVSGYGFIGYNTFRSAPATYGIRIRREFSN